jgi:hypothetical protein
MAFNQFKIYANNTVLDTYDDFDISLNYQITDITDITSRQTSFSKTIVIPGTKINNDFFENIFELNIDLSVSSYNPKVAIPCSISIGDEQIFTGNLQLLQISKNQGLVEYEIVITGILKNILFNFGDYFLSDLNMSEYNHQRNITNIEKSWNYEIVKNGGLVDAQGLGEGYVYPFINYGNSQDIATNSYVYDQYPAIYVKTIMDKLFGFAGYSYTSKFFETDYFKSLIVPFTNDKLQYSEVQLSALTTTVGVRNNLPEASPYLTNQYYAYQQTAGITGFRMIAPVLFRGTSYNNPTKNYYFPLELETGTVLGTTMQDPGNRWSTINGSKYVCNEDGYYDLEFDMNFIMKYIRTDGLLNTIRYQSGNFKYGASLMKLSNGVLTTLISAPSPNYYSSTFQPSSGTHPSPWYDTNTELNISMNLSNVYLLAGDQILIRFQISYASDFQWFLLPGPLSNRILAVPLIKNNIGGTSASLLSVKPSSNLVTAPNIQVDMNQVVPVMKMRDFFLSIVKMFNLVVADDPNKSGNILIDPKDIFYNSRKKIKDWSPLLDEFYDVKITPMSELDVRQYKFKYTEDDDYYNKQYTNETNEVYSNFEVDFLNEFSNDIKEVVIPFSPTPDTDNFISPRVAPFLADIDGTTTMKPKKSKPRILFYTGLKDGNFTLKNTPTSPTSTTYTQYPYTGMWDDPYDPSYDLGWGKPQKIYWNGGLFPTQTLTQMWWTTTLNELEDVNSKLVEAYFHLTPNEMANFDFRDIILLENNYYRVNKIVDYDPISVDKTTKVELYKISNIDFFPPLNQTLPESAYDCPTDVVAKKFKPNGYIYVSLSGQELGEDCCNLIGGIWTNGYCKAPNSVNGGVGVGNPVGSTSSFKSGVGSQTVSKATGSFNNSPVYTNKPVEQNKNNQSIDSPDAISLGFNNFVPKGSDNVVLVGNNISTTEDLTNVIAIGSNQQVSSSNSLFVNGVVLNGDSLSLAWSSVYIIDAGENDVMNYGKTNPIDIIDGGINSVRDFGGDSKARPIIDGSEPPFVI